MLVYKFDTSTHLLAETTVLLAHSRALPAPLTGLWPPYQQLRKRYEDND